MEHRHGGDIYAEDLTAEPLDFSASINPLGMPEQACRHYPAVCIIRILNAAGFVRRLRHGKGWHRDRYSAAMVRRMCYTA